VLRLPTMRRRFEEIAAAAQREQLSYLDFLAEVVMAPRCRFETLAILSCTVRRATW